MRTLVLRMVLRNTDKKIRKLKDRAIFYWILVASLPCSIILWHIIHAAPLSYERRPRKWKIHHHGETGGFSNIMFSYASIKGIAIATNRSSTFVGKFTKLHSAFSNTRMKIVNDWDPNYVRVSDLSFIIGRGCLPVKISKNAKNYRRPPYIDLE